MFSHFCEKCERMRIENALGENVKMRFDNVKKCEKCEQKAVEKFLFLSPICMFFFQVFFEF